MKHLFTLSLLAVAAMSAQAGNVLVGTKGYTVTIAEDGTEERTPNASSDAQYLYNAQGQQYLKVANGFTEYRYDEAGLLSAEVAYTNYNSAFQNMARYTYDEAGNVITKVVSTPNMTTTYTYGNYVNGQYTHYEVVYSTNPDNPTVFDVVAKFDDQNRLVRRYGQSAKTLEVMTYNGQGLLATLESEWKAEDYSDGLAVDPASSSYSRSEYTYNADGTLARVRSIRQGWDYASQSYALSVSDVDYVYADVDFSKVPANLRLEVQPVNMIAATWDAVEGAEAYIVTWNKSYGNETVTVATNSIVTPVLEDGLYYVNVQPVIAGEALAVSSTRTPIQVKDNTKLPATDFAFVSALHTVILHDGEWPWTEESYTVTVSWKEPETTGVVTGRKLSYGPSEWDQAALYDVELVDGVYTGKADLQSYACVDTNWDTMETSPKDVALSVVLVYTTGAADKSNEQVVKVAEVATEPGEEPGEDPVVGLQGVQSVRNIQAFNLNGQRVAGLKGVQIVRETLSDGSVRYGKVIR